MKIRNGWIVKLKEINKMKAQNGGTDLMEK